MKYLREWKDGSGVEELSKEQAKKHIRKWYPNMTDEEINDFLAKPRMSLNCMFSYLTVEE